MDDAEGARRRYKEIREKVMMKSILLRRGIFEVKDLIEGLGEKFRKDEAEEVESLNRVRRTCEARLPRSSTHQLYTLIFHRSGETHPDHPCLSKLLRQDLNAILNLAKSCSHSPSALYPSCPFSEICPLLFPFLMLPVRSEEEADLVRFGGGSGLEGKGET